MVVTFIHQKGGTGKSTMAIAFAMKLAGDGKNVMLLDVDPQGTSSTWGRRWGESYGVRIRSQIPRTVKEDVMDLRNRHEWLLLDSSPTVTTMTEQLIEISDALIVPMRPSEPDVWALDRLIGLIYVSDRKPPPPYLGVFNMCDAETAADHRIRLARRGLALSPHAVPQSPEWSAIFAGGALTDAQKDLISRILDDLDALLRQPPKVWGKA